MRCYVILTQQRQTSIEEVREPPFWLRTFFFVYRPNILVLITLWAR